MRDTVPTYCKTALIRLVLTEVPSVSCKGRVRSRSRAPGSFILVVEVGAVYLRPDLKVFIKLFPVDLRRTCGKVHVFGDMPAAGAAYRRYCVPHRLVSLTLGYHLLIAPSC